MIANPLSTVRAANRIDDVDHGVVKESGTHEELFALGGIYAGMVSKQPHEDVEHSEGEVEPSGYEIAETGRDSVSDTKTDTVASSSEVSFSGMPKKPALFQTIVLNKPEWVFLFGGPLFFAASGMVLLAFSLVYAEVFQLFLETGPTSKRARASYLDSIFAALGFIAIALAIAGNASLGIAGARLTKRARKLFFNSILRQIDKTISY